MTLRERIEAEIARKQAIAEDAQAAVGDADWHATTGHKPWVVETMDKARYVVSADSTEEVAIHIATFDPGAVLAGLAEDRDILKRHRQSADVAYVAGVMMTALGLHTVCVYCSDLDSEPMRVVGWPCWDAISVARRHGIEPS